MNLIEKLLLCIVIEIAVLGMFGLILKITQLYGLWKELEKPAYY